MLDPPASLAITLALVPVVAWCVFCSTRRAGHHADDVVPADVEACHAGMGFAMVVMLWVPLSSGRAWIGAGAFAAMTVWSVGRLRLGGVPGWYRRLGVMAAAMAAMLLPAGAATAAAPGAQDPTMHMSRSSMDMTASGPATPGSHGADMLLSGAGALVVALALAAVALAAFRSSIRPGPTRARLSGCCEGVAAAAMAVMALALL